MDIWYGWKISKVTANTITKRPPNKNDCSIVAALSFSKYAKNPLIILGIDSLNKAPRRDEKKIEKNAEKHR